MEKTVVVRDLVKSYGHVQAVRGVSFEISKGEIFGLLGPNGAGKTTTLECAIGLREPDAGSIEVCGVDALEQPREVKQRIGAQLQATYLQDKITPREALKLFSSFYRRRADPETLLKSFSLTEKADAHFESLSGGQKQRLAIALALVNEPDLLLLDEPTAGLDPQSRHELHDVIRKMRNEGRTVLLTTHYMEEAELLCDRVAVIDRGKVIAEGTPAELTAGAKSMTRVVCTTARAVEEPKFRALPEVERVDNNAGHVVLYTRKVSATVTGLVRLLDAEKNELLDLDVQKSSLEEVFIELTGRNLRD